jgi:hypothetical protein
MKKVITFAMLLTFCLIGGNVEAKMMKSNNKATNKTLKVSTSKLFEKKNNKYNKNILVYNCTLGTEITLTDSQGFSQTYTLVVNAATCCEAGELMDMFIEWLGYN